MLIFAELGSHVARKYLFGIIKLNFVPLSKGVIIYFISVDIRRLALADGAGVTVVVRGGEPYLLKVELPSILPSHSREVLETIRRVRPYCHSQEYMCLNPHGAIIQQSTSDYSQSISMYK